MSRLLKNNELYHFGITGMRWGVRRYQYEDGTLTPEGILRYRKAKSDVEKPSGNPLNPISEYVKLARNYKYVYSIPKNMSNWEAHFKYGEKAVPSEERFNDMVKKYADRRIEDLEKEIEYNRNIDDADGVENSMYKLLTPDVVERARVGLERKAVEKMKELFPEYDKTPLVLTDQNGKSYKREEGGDFYTREIDDKHGNKAQVTIDTASKPVEKKAFTSAESAEKLLTTKNFKDKLIDFIANAERKEGYIDNDDDVVDMFMTELRDKSSGWYGARVIPSGKTIFFSIGEYEVEYDVEKRKFVGHPIYND